jgi:hypothetical protein
MARVWKKEGRGDVAPPRPPSKLHGRASPSTHGGKPVHRSSMPGASVFTPATSMTRSSGWRRRRWRSPTREGWWQRARAAASSLCVDLGSHPWQAPEAWRGLCRAGAPRLGMEGFLRRWDLSRVPSSDNPVPVLLAVHATRPNHLEGLNDWERRGRERVWHVGPTSQ